MRPDVGNMRPDASQKFSKFFLSVNFQFSDMYKLMQLYNYKQLKYFLYTFITSDTPPNLTYAMSSMHDMDTVYKNENGVWLGRDAYRHLRMKGV